MNMSQRIPQIGEIIVVPLAHPNGVYIRKSDNTKIPILAKVRSKFGDMVNVINYFGYIYNVPISHTEPINQSLPTNFYVDMINNAQTIIHSLGYTVQDNSDFYNTIPGITYTFFPYLPGYDGSYATSIPFMTQSQYIDNTNIANIPIITNGEDYDDTFESTINVMKIDDNSLLHVISRTYNNISFDSSKRMLDIRGYCKFIIDESYTYVRNDDINEYVIFRSDRNYIHVKKSKIRYDNIHGRRQGRPNIPNKSNKLNRPNRPNRPNGPIKNNTHKYRIRMIRPDRNNTKHVKYFNIIEIIHNELSN